ncbi:MAG TPA: sodium:proton antiporter [Polyangiaceae bacterium]|nr:sodium:proton antiporter [Polyangiaceae bacterium]
MPLYPTWTLIPFPLLVLAIALLPLLLPHWWEKPTFQAAIAVACAAPIVAFSLSTGHGHEVSDAAYEYLAFITTLGALYVTAGGIHLAGDLVATPKVNLTFLLLGSLLASLVGTTGASMLLIRPLLRTNQQRERTAHLVPFFIVMVANAGGLLTPLGDPPLLVGYIEGVPFFWTLKLLPIWLLYVLSIGLTFYLVDRQAFARETSVARERDVLARSPLSMVGRRNVALLLAVIPASMLPPLYREVALVGIAGASALATPRAVHDKNAFSYAPIIDVALVFGGLFLCLGPVQAALSSAAPSLPVQKAWQMFWGAGVFSAVLDNAPTYSAFTALARGLPAGGHPTVAGVDPFRLAAISVGSVVMGATTYIGNGPNLMVKAIAERAGLQMPSFLRYALFAVTIMLPAHLVTTVALWWVEDLR